MRLVYDLFIFLFQFGLRIAAFGGHRKAKQWIAGRKKLFDTVSISLKPGEQRVWFHCASLGEFEQGRPLLEQYKRKHPNRKIVLTFFSPSGYEVRKNYAEADYIFYLPLDLPGNAERFISLINPVEVFFIKYEYWFHYFEMLGRKKIPVYLVSAIFRNDQPFFKWYGTFFRKMLQSVNHFFLQDKASAILLDSISIANYTVTGDTRFDRVSQIAVLAQSNPGVEHFRKERKLFIAGSTWREDEQLIRKALENCRAEIVAGKIGIVIAPHEITEARIQSIEKEFAAFRTIRYSIIAKNSASDADLLILDNIGLLSSVYRHGSMAYVGGGFGKGIHNVLEPAVFAVPVFFGPNYFKFSEAKELLEVGGAFSIHTPDELKLSWMTDSADELQMKSASVKAKQYVSKRTGATNRILDFLEHQNTNR